MSQFSVCVLLYGPHRDLAERCLSSISRSSPPAGVVKDIRLGLNEVVSSTNEFVADWAQQQVVPVYAYRPRYRVGQPPFKYPLMRRMFHDTLRPLAESVMWFDDDSYLDGATEDWWKQLAVRMQACDMLGQKWRWKVQPGQQAWFNSTKWRNPATPAEVGWPFFQGAWWCLRSRVLKELDWPIPELRHFGGDSLLGEILRHRGASLVEFDDCVKINADDLGRRSKSPRRGTFNHIERPIGYGYSGGPLPLDHHDFGVTVTHYLRK